MAGPSHTHASSVDEEVAFLHEAIGAATYIMNDDIDGADAELAKANSSFHQLGRGVTSFMRALLGFEPEVMKAALERLSEAETSAAADQKKAQKDQKAFRSKVYPPGTEYAVVVAEAELMSAVVSVLNENITDALRGFYKLRKAFMTLDGIMEAEHKYMRILGGLSGNSKASVVSQKHMPGGFDDDEFVEPGHARQGTPAIAVQKPAGTGSSSPENHDSDMEFVDADESHSGALTPANYQGHVSTTDTLTRDLNNLQLQNDQELATVAASMPTDVKSLKSLKREGITLDANSEVFSHPLDVFIHSATNLCYGLLLLIISLIPPAFSKLLSIIGFKGDRERGLNMLWQSTKFSNINGAVAGLVLLAYYNINIGFSDILLPDAAAGVEDIRSYPRAKCQALLEEMRQRYPKSRLWRLEEARMTSQQRNLLGAKDLLIENKGSPMKQIAAINLFELALTAMFNHDYNECAQSFLDMAEISNWSHVLYYYIAGAAHFEMYRRFRTSNPAEAAAHKAKATEYLLKAPTVAGKKRLMAKQLPFDVFVVRKVKKWEMRQKALKIDFVDCIGVSPIEEMIYLWNGSKRMGPCDLKVSLANLAWSRTDERVNHENDLDEVALHAVLSSAILRQMGRVAEAREVLKNNVLNHEKYVLSLLITAFLAHLLTSSADTNSKAS